MKKKVVIVGRSNVGKSTLFNCLTEKSVAIVDRKPGITRDRHYGKVSYRGCSFTLIDTGGCMEKEEIYNDKILEQVLLAIQESFIILFVVDGRSGLTVLDDRIAQYIRKLDKKFLLVVNKTEGNPEKIFLYDFYQLGLEKIYPISAAHKIGTEKLLQVIIDLLPQEKKQKKKELIHFSFIGHTNVGKSTLLNSYLKENRSIVDESAHTTRDSHNNHYHLYGYNLILTDTAGIPPRAKIKEKIIARSVKSSIIAIRKTDICFILIDAVKGLTNQDKHLIKLTINYKKGILILVNKWDLLDGSSKIKMDKTVLQESLGNISYIPIIYISAKKKLNILQALKKGIEVYKNKYSRIGTAKLNKILQKAIKKHPHPQKNQPITLNYITQLPLASPTFILFSNHPSYVNSNYLIYLENFFRKYFSFEGVPIKFVLRDKRT